VSGVQAQDGLGANFASTRGFEEGTFECFTCERTEKVSVAVDPMRTDTLALQLLSLRTSESMGNHDSNVVGAGRVG
jgi:hypothetical protein